MKISGEFTVNAPRDKVWETLNDVGALGSMIPGAKGLTEVGPDEYTASMDLVWSDTDEFTAKCGFRSGMRPTRTSFRLKEIRGMVG